MNGRKGQAATEYLIILAVVVIIALIVIGVLGGFPGMTRGISERDSATYWTVADVGIIRYNLPASGNSTFVFRNNKNFQVELVNLTVDATTLSLGNATVAPDATLAFTNVSINCGGAAGSSFSHNIVITYKDPQYGNVYTFTGEKPLVGTCQ
jgi:hypothetical protein